MRSSEYKGLAFILGIILIALVYLIKFLLSSVIGILLLIIIFLVVIVLITKKLIARNKFQRNSNIKSSTLEMTSNYIDVKGYEREGDGSLIHRNIAYEEIYKDGYIVGEYPERFSYYDVHHIDGNKRNNSPENLQIVTREEHDQIHQLHRTLINEKKIIKDKGHFYCESCGREIKHKGNCLGCNVKKKNTSILNS